RPLSGAAELLIEERLVAALLDPDPVGQLDEGVARLLAARWGVEDFDLSRWPEERERQLRGLADRWRHKHGLGPLPPPSRAIPAAPAAQVQPLLRAAVEGTPDRQRQALADLEALGLPALGAVRQQLAVLPAGHPLRGELGALAGRLEMTV